MFSLVSVLCSGASLIAFSSVTFETSVLVRLKAGSSDLTVSEDESGRVQEAASDTPEDWFDPFSDVAVLDDASVDPLLCRRCERASSDTLVASKSA